MTFFPHLSPEAQMAESLRLLEEKQKHEERDQLRQQSEMVQFIEGRTAAIMMVLNEVLRSTNVVPGRLAEALKAECISMSEAGTDKRNPQFFKGYASLMPYLPKDK